MMAPWALLALTFLIGVGFTFYMPAQQASINDLVGRTEVPQAVALGAVAMNVSRAVGPAAAGAVAAWVGTGSAFLASAACFVAMVFVVRTWPPQPPSLPGVPETLLSGINSGLRFARHSAPMRAIITRNLTFSVCASALWALLPVIARDQLGLGAGGFGLLFGCFGGGAVVGALTIPRHLSRYSLNKVVTGFALLWVIASTLVAATTITPVALVGAFGAGAAWVGVLASLGAATQSAAPAWVRARAVAMNFFTVQASLALGSVAWGVLASWGGTRIALLASAAALLILQGVNRWARVRLGRDRDVLPGAQLPDLHIAVEPQPDDGPVLIQIEYRIDARAAQRVPARDARDGAGAPAQRRVELAHVPRPGRGREVRGTVHPELVGRIRAAALADDDRRPPAARGHRETPASRHADPRVTPARHRPLGGGRRTSRTCRCTTGADARRKRGHFSRGGHAFARHGIMVGLRAGARRRHPEAPSSGTLPCESSISAPAPPCSPRKSCAPPPPRCSTGTAAACP